MKILAAGQENFQLDHFCPQSLFPKLINDFFNLRYACYPCNHGKRDTWPTPELQETGCRFVNFCEEIFSIHFQEAEDGRWLPLTPAAAYTEAQLRLNRLHLIRIRGWLRKLALLRNVAPINWDEPSKEQIGRLI